MTWNELYDPAMTAETEEEAKAHLARIMAYLRANLTAPPDEDDLRAIVRRNLGYWAGYYALDIAARVERLYGAVHPLLGPVAERRALFPSDSGEVVEVEAKR